MAKTIVFCADGTWNAPADPHEPSALDAATENGELPPAAVTNVVKVFDNLVGSATEGDRKEQEKAEPGRLVAKYIHGVGNSPSLTLRFLGGLFGVGVIMRVVRGYTFISRNYQAGDAIHVVGFSRGAYTARALGGLIAKVGLLDPGSYNASNKDEAYRLGIAAWCRSKSMSLGGDHRLTGFADRIFGFGQTLMGAQLRDRNLIPDVPVASVAVWDTVGSMGIPDYERDERVDVLQFGDLDLSPRVARGFHAMAIDELRRDFPVTRWAPRTGVEEVWFAGAHGDVGGGYDADECRLSDLALGWMMRKLADAGVPFGMPLTHPLDGGASDGTCHEPWGKLPFSVLPKSPRVIRAGDVFHASVRERWERTSPRYRPTALAAFSDLSGVRWDDGRYA